MLQARYHLDSLNNKQGVMCLGSCVPLRWLVAWPISIDKDSRVYRHAEHRPDSTLLFRSQNGLRRVGGPFIPAVLQTNVLNQEIVVQDSPSHTYALTMCARVCRLLWTDAFKYRKVCECIDLIIIC